MSRGSCLRWGSVRESPVLATRGATCVGYPAPPTLPLAPSPAHGILSSARRHSVPTPRNCWNYYFIAATRARESRPYLFDIYPFIPIHLPGVIFPFLTIPDSDTFVINNDMYLILIEMSNAKVKVIFLNFFQ